LADVHFTWSTQNTAEIPGGNSCGLCHASFLCCCPESKRNQQRSRDLSL
jgi:hypothetical protein